MKNQKVAAILASWIFVVGRLAPFVVAVDKTTNDFEKHEHRREDLYYLLGTGIADITGPAAEINFMGYARTSQTAHGIHLRLRSRAFIMAEVPPNTDHKSTPDFHTQEEIDPLLENQRGLRWSFGRKKRLAAPQSIVPGPDKTICFVSIDAGMGSDLLNTRVLKRLQELLPPLPGNEGDNGKRLCHIKNLGISGTHTHSAPAGFLQYTLYQITSAGFSEETMRAFVEGVAQSIARAYQNLQLGTIEVAEELLFSSNINRSPTSYLLNPKEERDEYSKEGDTDKRMLQLNLRKTQAGKQSSPNRPLLGILNWFSVHGTSMNATNKLISGDNKGYASYLMERTINGPDKLVGTGDFVAAFASTNLGDVSPNTRGPRCQDTGLPCDVGKSSCNGRSQMCIAAGPGKDMEESTKIIGERQFDLAKKLIETNNLEQIRGPVDYRHSFINMAFRNVTLGDGTFGRTCPAALGYSFAAGTTDGPGDFDFTQGTNSSNPFWNMIGAFISKPKKDQIDCHAPKPILLNTGGAKLPYDWDPESVPVSILRVGQLFILNVPGEFTTMAGRRLRKAVAKVLKDHNVVQNPIITIAGLSNSYTHYITTFEEYQGQRYEAASTLYGPHTLTAYIREFERLVTDMCTGKPSESDPPPPDLSHRQISFLPPVALDTIGLGRKFGSVAQDAKEMYSKGDSVLVSFRSANPRNNQRLEGTFLTVDKLNTDTGAWTTKYVDGDWCTKYYWKGSIMSLGISFADITWDIPEDEDEGWYRVCHYGTRKTLISDGAEGFLHAPDWLITNTFGSILIGSVNQLTRMILALVHAFPSITRAIDRSRYRDFQGCSRTFKVS